MGNFFEGFLKGFSTTGAEMLKEQDAAQQRINEITKQGEITLGNTLKEIREKAKIELEIQKAEKERAYAAAGYGAPSVQGPSILQTQEAPAEEVIDDQGNVLMSSTDTPVSPPVQSQTTSMPPSAAQVSVPPEVAKYMVEYLNTDVKPEEAKKLAWEQYRKEKDTAVKVKEEQSAAKRKATADQWLKIRGSKDDPIAQLEARAIAAPSKLLQLEEVLVAAERSGVTTKLGAFVNRYLPDLSSDAKKVLDAGIEDVAARAAAFRPLSNEEKELLLRAAPSLDNPVEFNRYKIKLMQYLYTRDAKFLEFKTMAEQELGLDPTAAMVAWTKYERSLNKKLTEYKDMDEARAAVEGDESWVEFLTNPKGATTAAKTSAAPPAPAATPPTAKTPPEKKPEGRFTLDDLLSDNQ